MNVKSMFNRLLGRTDRYDVPASEIANASQEEVDRKIDQTQAISKRVIGRAREEIAHSERIIILAEQAVRSLRKVEKQT